MIGRQIKQINRLRLAKGQDGLFRVYTPDRSTCLEEFGRQDHAESWMQETADYTKRGKRS